MKIRYINEAVFGNYKKPTASKEERMEKIKNETSKIAINHFINDFRKLLVPYINTVYSSLSPYSIGDLGFDLDESFNDDPSKIDIKMDKKGQTWLITIGLPLLHTYSGVSYDDFILHNGELTFGQWLALAQCRYISNEEEITDFCKEFFGDDNFLLECKFSIMNDSVQRITITQYDEFSIFKKVFLRFFTTFHVETEDLYIKNSTAFKVDKEELDKLLQYITPRRGVTFRY